LTGNPVHDALEHTVGTGPATLFGLVGAPVHDARDNPGAERIEAFADVPGRSRSTHDRHGEIPLALDGLGRLARIPTEDEGWSHYFFLPAVKSLP
jgi:hypothetical protein